MKILLTNDDGIGADGMHAAWHALQNAGHEVIVCVPDLRRQIAIIERAKELGGFA